jgi:hypothetical protein
MDRASGSMEEGDAPSAEEQQKEAERKLREIQKELAEEERRYEGIHQEELLFLIGKELAALVEGQGAVNTGVKNLDAARAAAEGKLSRVNAAILRDLQAKETDLAAKAEVVAGAIEKEGSDVYGFVLRALVEDMTRLAGGFQDLDTGDGVQVLGAEISRRLKKLADALKFDREMMKKLAEQRDAGNQGGGGGGGGGDQKQPLVPPDAELRLLRDLQTELNAAIEELSADIKADPTIDDRRRTEAERLARKQARLRDIWLKLAEKFHLDTNGAPDAGGAEVDGGGGDDGK